jgi:ribosomal protection tetracycline resistance protein
VPSPEERRAPVRSRCCAACPVPGAPPRRRRHRFAPATLQALVEPDDPTRRTALFAALTELADEDPLIDLRIDASAGEAAVSLHGEVQKEVIAAVLAERYGVAATFSATSVVCLERVAGRGQAVDRIKVGDNPYLAGIGLRVEATETGSGLIFDPGIERGNLPPAFIAATEEGARAALRQGLHGWAVTDGVVTMTESGYYPRQSKPHQKFDKGSSSVAADFRSLAQVVVVAALSRAGTVVCQPVEHVELDVPVVSLGPVTALLGRLGARTRDSSSDGERVQLVVHLPTARVPELAGALPDLTGGEALLVHRLDHHARVSGDHPPARARRGPDPRDRFSWFRAVPR